MNFDWNLGHAFLATAETGSLTAAARRLGLTQPTLSRQVATFEADLGVTLFERVGKRLVLTETGHSLLQHVRAMAEAAGAFQLAAAGRDQTIEGRVCISATDAYCVYILPDIIERIRREAPQITLVIDSSDSLSDLHRREADIALRHVRPDSDDLVCKRVRECTGRFYASSEWISRNGHPRVPQDIAPNTLMGIGDVHRFATFLREMGIPANAESFRLVSENSVVLWELVKRGLGIGVMLQEIASRTDGVVDLFGDAATVKVPLWLVCHRELRTSRRIRLVFDILAEELASLDRPTRNLSF